MPRVSGIERMMAEALAARGIKADAQYEIGPFVVDFALTEFNIVLECDGDYWHNLPKQIKKDRAKDAYLLKCGWKVLRIKECDIRASVDQCVDRVLQATRDIAE